MNLFVRAWKGEASLAAAFWLIYFLFGLILAIIVSLILRMVNPDFFANPYAHRIVGAICFPYTLYSIVCVWRCAKNSNAFWRVIARIIMILALVFGLLNLWEVSKHATLRGEESRTRVEQTDTSA